MNAECNEDEDEDYDDDIKDNEEKDEEGDGGDCNGEKGKTPPGKCAVDSDKKVDGSDDGAAGAAPGRSRRLCCPNRPHPSRAEFCRSYHCNHVSQLASIETCLLFAVEMRVVRRACNDLAAGTAVWRCTG